VALAATGPDRSPAGDRLHALFESAWQQELADNPMMATYTGDPRYNDRWTDLSAAGIARRHQHDRDTLSALRAIPRTGLTPAEQLDYDLFAREYEQRLATHAFKPWLYQIDHMGGIQTLSETAEILPFQSVKDQAPAGRGAAGRPTHRAARRSRPRGPHAAACDHGAPAAATRAAGRRRTGEEPVLPALPALP
jgi:uncharacterized protein (DUF885 family)